MGVFFLLPPLYYRTEKGSSSWNPVLPSQGEAEIYRKKYTETARSATLASSYLLVAKVALSPSYFILLSQGATCS